ncbi:MAG TPA: DUF1697 domain-containing protein [Mycobacterium sp.]
MASYVAFLRGINLGPRNKIAMPALRELATGLGYTEVATHINSGNLILDSTKKAATLEREITAAIAETFGFKIDVAVRTPAQLKKILDDNPYPDGNPSQVTVAFLTKPAPASAQEKVAAIATEAEPFTFAGQDVYVHYSNGLGTSKLAERFSAIIGVSSTVRNINTVTKIVALCNQRG